ncbi:TonB family protein [Puniceicoccales bacterium CK1056]|uniref:TonB family protein n=1 Tax=Oceanipulchritudo coccoides TaxID=2706888 RepID=A0A6B2M0N8_9BACT|nr:TonB family protein [Oceanipulchritudo coccoides]NDV61597.1 TonB family protein [Oceanipulchritudo coccoides]
MKILTQSILLSVLALGGSVLSAAPQTMELKAPQAIEIIEPEVPVNYMRWGIKGHVVVTFQINEEGQPENIHLVDYDDRVYAKVVTKALRQWRFEKPEVEGITYRLPINFI